MNDALSPFRSHSDRFRRFLLNKLTVPLLLLLGMLTTSPGWAQNTLQVTGRVTGENGQPLARASVGVRGSIGGVTADDNGRYTITAPPNGVLVVSAVGHASQDISIKKSC